jgi:hypothetical protein
VTPSFMERGGKPNPSRSCSGAGVGGGFGGSVPLDDVAPGHALGPSLDCRLAGAGVPSRRRPFHPFAGGWL